MTEADSRRNYVVEYTLDYQHVVQVGVTAQTTEEAIQIAETAFDAGTIWDDTEAMPLLFDDFEESSGGRALQFTAAEVESFPPADSSVAVLKRRDIALELLLVAQEAALALETLDSRQTRQRAATIAARLRLIACRAEPGSKRRAEVRREN